MKLYYIWDAYCGWCYGFEGIFTTFMEKHPELEVHITSGGLFTGKRIKPLSTYDFMKSGNEQIKSIYGAAFSEAYNSQLNKGELVINSNHPAIAYSLIKAYLAPQEHVAFVYAMQKKFFQEGKSLSDLRTYAELIETYQLPEILNEELAAAWDNYSLAEEDFNLAAQMGVTSYPTLIAEKDGTFYDLRQNAYTLADLEANYQRLLRA
ncbi:DsbA family protein [Streptococcus ruminantium]|uniref:Thioredoxin n=1 Tax=Streptococcus ruminantium TaxID=1917441 RepID=A0ABU1B3Q3_9STRE|nr:thioredoxin [Streptococcus ruminantium]MDQ8759757.1 thioredoxin [Streptococcus ruminantium]MDQ8764394.1 thioredoxin [Streptococcus ruminantium]MDQ8766429.1 thioredoxin [Streptococcus ruminantium]MDQ8769613.1 thioredoxin [Streptococcus ruminantium]MDQ8775251.1 thioredoxin [Streptococcus ruminantium]